MRIPTHQSVSKVKDNRGRCHDDKGHLESCRGGSGAAAKKPEGSSLDDLANFSLGPSTNKPRTERSPTRLVETKVSNLPEHKTVSSHIDRLVTASPDLQSVSIQVNTSDLREHLSRGEAAKAYAIHNRGKVTLNEKYFGNREKFTEDLKAQEAKGFHPRGCNTPESMITHELGHVLFEGLGSKGDERSDEIDDLIREAHKSGELAKVSRYATQGLEEDDLREAKAEIYASIHHTPTKGQQPLVRKVARILQGKTQEKSIMAPSALDRLPYLNFPHLQKSDHPVKIELSANDSNGQLAELLSYIRHNGNGGHSFVIIVDPDLRENTKRFSWDGDGSDRIEEIKVNGDVLKGLDYSDVHVPRLGDSMADEEKEGEEGLEKASDSDYVRQALADESEGMTAYSQALESITDPKLKEILAAITEDEKKHNMALEAWLKENDPAALEGHEGEESSSQESAEGDEAAEEKDDETGDKQDLIDQIEAVLAEHDDSEPEEKDEGNGVAEDDETVDGEDDDSEAAEGEDLDKDDDEDDVAKCSLDKFMPIVKLDDDQHKAYCVVAEPDVFDLQGDRSSAEDIEKASDRFMERLQKTCARGVGYNHERPIDAHVIENVVTKQDGMKLGSEILRKGTWYQGHKIEDEEIWKKIKSGEITGLSRQGVGVRMPVGKGMSEIRRVSKSGRVMKTKLYDLSDEDIDRIDWVGKAANGKRIAIIKFTGGAKMKTKPAGADKAGAGGALVSKADILEIVQKALEPLKEENAELRKELRKQTSILRKRDLESIAKAELPELDGGAEILKSLEGLPSEARKPIIKALKQANAMKAEAGKMLYKSVGSSRPAPGSVSAQFYSLVDARLGEIRKSTDHAGKSEKVLKAMAVAAITKERRDLAKAVLAEERAAHMRAQWGVS